jgi:uncharacterized protein DUF3999
VKRAVCALMVATSMNAGASARFERQVKAMPGANRLDVDVPLLAGAASDLHDLRLYDAGGKEVAYLLVQPAPQEPRWLPSRIAEIAATKTSSGFEGDLGSIADVDRVRVENLDAPFLKHVRLEGSGDRQHWTLLSDATLFDLPDDKLRRTEIDFVAGEFRYLRFTWDDRSSARIVAMPTVSARVHRSGAPPPPIRAALPFVKRPSEPGKSRFHIPLPGPHLPLTGIEVEVESGNVYRQAAITEPRFANGEVVPVPVGSGGLKRAERNGAVASEMTVPVAGIEGRELDLAVDDGSNPPLVVSRLIGVFAPQPWIYFESPAGGTLVARYGDGREPAPRYDLEAKRKDVQQAPVEHAVWLTTPAEDRTMKGEVPKLPKGAPIDASAFKISRPIPAGEPGMVVLALDADVLARSNEMADLRIVDRNGDQIPYVLERKDEPLSIALHVPPAATRGKTSVYDFALPFDTLPSGTKLVLRTNERVFQRTVSVSAPADERRNREPLVLSTASWSATEPDLAPPTLTFDPPLAGMRSIVVTVDEGDNARLPIAGAELLLPSFAIRFPHPGGDLRLLYGNPSAEHPRYDLELLASRLRAEPAREVALAPAETPRAAESSSRDRMFFWGAIAVAVIALLAILGRLLKHEPPLSG